MKYDFTLISFALFISEQIAMVKLGSYPYLWGVPFARKTLPKDLNFKNVGGFIGRMKIKNDHKGNIFIRYKYPPLTWGPYVFVGQIRNEDPTQMMIRLGPLTCLFFIAFIIEGLFAGFVSSIIALVTFACLIYFSLNSFQKGYEKIVVEAANKI